MGAERTVYGYQHGDDVLCVGCSPPQTPGQPPEAEELYYESRLRECRDCTMTLEEALKLYEPPAASPNPRAHLTVVALHRVPSRVVPGGVRLVSQVEPLPTALPVPTEPTDLWNRLSVRAAHALRVLRFNAATFTPEVLATVDARAVRGLTNIGSKTVTEIRDLALSVGVDLVNADAVCKTPSAFGPWEITETRVVGEKLALRLRCGTETLKLLRPKSDAAQLHAGQWVEIRLDVVDAPEPPETTP